MEGEINLTQLYEQKFDSLFDSLTTRGLPLEQIVASVKECIKYYDLYFDENNENDCYASINTNFWFASVFEDERLENNIFLQERLFENFFKYIEYSVKCNIELTDEIVGTTLVFYASKNLLSETQIRLFYENFRDRLFDFASDYYLSSNTPDYIADKLLLVSNSKDFQTRLFEKTNALDVFQINIISLQRARLLLVDTDVRIPQQVARSKFTQTDLLYILQDNHDESTVANPDFSIPYYTIADLATINLNSRE